MAELSRYFQRQNVDTNVISLSNARTGAEQIGDAVSDVGAAAAQIAQRDEDFWVEKKLSELDTGADRDWDSMVETAPPDGAGFERDYLGAIDGRYNDARAAAPSRRAAQKLDLGITRQRSAREARARGF